MNCYDLLGVTRESSRGEISKAYRKLAGQWHPDKFMEQEQKKEAEVSIFYETFPFVHYIIVIKKQPNVLKNKYVYVYIKIKQKNLEQYWQFYKFYVLPGDQTLELLFAIYLLFLQFILYFQYELKYFADIRSSDRHVNTDKRINSTLFRWWKETLKTSTKIK